MYTFTLSGKELTALQNPSLVEGTGGWQDFFIQLELQRDGSTQQISEHQLMLARRRAKGTGTWQKAYRIIVSHFPNKAGTALHSAIKQIAYEGPRHGESIKVTVTWRKRRSKKEPLPSSLALFGPKKKSEKLRNRSSVTIDPSQIDELINRVDVLRVDLPVRLSPKLDAAHLFSGVGVFGARGGLTGKGVIIGIIDSGIDSLHPAFAGRIAAVWDQVTSVGQPPKRFGYGTLHQHSEVNQCEDTCGHGTHVAGVAAGNDPLYSGVAPQATIVFVQTDFEDEHIVDAAEFIFDLAKTLDMPAVVNISAGHHDHAHDGEDRLSKDLGELTGPGRIITACAGNEGNRPIRGVATIAPEESYRFPLTLPLTQKSVLTGWYSGSQSCEIAIESGGEVSPYQAIRVNSVEAEAYQLASLWAVLVTPSHQPNGAHEFRVDFRSAIGSHVVAVLVKNVSAEPVTVDIWSVDGPDWDFASFGPAVAHPLKKICSPGCCKEAITIGAIVTKTEWPDSLGNIRQGPGKVGSLAEFSNPGPLAEFNPPGPLKSGGCKPDFVAPGAMVASALSSAYACAEKAKVSPIHCVDGGTSISSPFVAGVIALLLEKKPELTPEEVRQKLKRISLKDDNSNGYDPYWGHGSIGGSPEQRMASDVSGRFLNGLLED